MEFPVDDSYSVFHCRMHLCSKNDRKCSKILHALHRNKALLFFMAVQTRINQTKELSRDTPLHENNNQSTLYNSCCYLLFSLHRSITLLLFIRISDHCRCSKVREDILFLTNALIPFHRSLVVGQPTLLQQVNDSSVISRQSPCFSHGLYAFEPAKSPQ
jgi:hypothetical protein